MKSASGHAGFKRETSRGFREVLLTANREPIRGKVKWLPEWMAQSSGWSGQARSIEITKGADYAFTNGVFQPFRVAYGIDAITLLDRSTRGRS